MNLRDYLAIVRDYWKSILVITAVGALAAAGFIWITSRQANFTAGASVYISVHPASIAPGVGGGADYAGTQASSFAKLASMDVVLQPVVKKLGLPLSTQELGKAVNSWSDGSVVQILVTYPEEKASTSITQAIAEQLIQTVDRLSPVDESGQPVLAAEIVNPAGAPIVADGGLSTKSTLALGLLGGLVVGLVQASLRKVLQLSAPAESRGEA